MKTKSSLAFLAAAVLAVSTTCPAAAQAPALSQSPTPAGNETTVYLSKDYTKSLEADKLFDSDKFVAVFVGFEAEFAIFKQAGIKEQIYIPKTAILYMRGPGEPKLKVNY